MLLYTYYIIKMDPQAEEQKKRDEEKQTKLKIDEEIKKNAEGNNKDKNSYEHLFLQNVFNIHINIETNIPKSTPVLLTSSMFIQDDVSKDAEKVADFPLSEFPFFTTEIQYPPTLFQNLPREDILFFFFNKSFFKRSIMNLLTLAEIKTMIDTANKTAEEKENETQNGEYNIQIMLRILFSVVFPQKYDVFSSLDRLIKREPVASPPIFINPTYTYLSINKQVFTATRVVWLNDLFNHPLYKNVCFDFLNYKKWCDSEIKRSQKKTADLTQTLKKKLDKHNFEKDLRYVENLLKPKTTTSKISQKDTLNLTTIIRIIKKIDAFLKLGETDAFKKMATEIDNEFIYSNETEIMVEFQFPPYKVPLERDKGYWYLGFFEQIPEEKDKLKIVIYKSSNKTEKLFEFVEEKRLIKNYNVREPKINKIIKKLEDERQNPDYYDMLKLSNFNVSYSSGNVYQTINNFFINGWDVSKTKTNNIIFPFGDTPTEFNDNVDTFLKLFNDEKYVARYKNFPDETSDTQKTPIDVLVSTIVTLDQLISSSYIDNESLKFYKALVETAKELVKSTKFSKEYLKNATVNIKKKDDFKSYQDAESLIKSLEMLLDPQRESANNKLQNILISYSKNDVSKITFGQIMGVLEPCFYTFDCKPIENSRDKYWLTSYMNTSFQNINIGDLKKPQYEIYIHIDLVKGKLDAANVDKIKCEYKDIKLTDQFNRLFKKKRTRDWILQNYPYIDISEKSAAVPAVKPSRKGGKKKTRRLKNIYLRKTIKLQR